MTKSPIILPSTGQPEPSLELRINSPDDAMLIVQHSKRIHDEMVARGLTSIEFLVAKGLEKAVDKLLIGVFRVKMYFKSVSPQPGNLFMSLPHAQSLPVPIRRVEQPRESSIVARLLPEPKRPGRPAKQVQT